MSFCASADLAVRRDKTRRRHRPPGGPAPRLLRDRLATGLWSWPECQRDYRNQAKAAVLVPLGGPVAADYESHSDEEDERTDEHRRDQLSIEDAFHQPDEHNAAEDRPQDLRLRWRDSVAQ